MSLLGMVCYFHNKWRNGFFVVRPPATPFKSQLRGTLIVIAFVDQVQSAETLTIEITQVSQPTYTVKTDGGNSGNLVFQTKYVVTAQAPGGTKVHYRENDEAAAV